MMLFSKLVEMKTNNFPPPPPKQNEEEKKCMYAEKRQSVDNTAPRRERFLQGRMISRFHKCVLTMGVQDAAVWRVRRSILSTRISRKPPKRWNVSIIPISRIISQNWSAWRPQAPKVWMTNVLQRPHRFPTRFFILFPAGRPFS